MKVFTEWTVLPHRPIEKLTDNLWRVSGIVGSIQRQMAVGRLRDGRLMIVNAIALDEPASSPCADLEAALAHADDGGADALRDGAAFAMHLDRLAALPDRRSTVSPAECHRARGRRGVKGDGQGSDAPQRMTGGRPSLEQESPR